MEKDPGNQEISNLKNSIQNIKEDDQLLSPITKTDNTESLFKRSPLKSIIHVDKNFDKNSNKLKENEENIPKSISRINSSMKILESNPSKLRTRKLSSNFENIEETNIINQLIRPSNLKNTASKEKKNRRRKNRRKKIRK